MTRFYLAYLTANDAPLYLADFLNFRNMALHDPGAGIAKICVYIAASGVQPFGDNDRAAFSGLVQLSERCRWLEVRRIFFKGNVGRDFSSAEVCLQAIGEEAGPSDYVLVRNRSAAHCAPGGTATTSNSSSGSPRLASSAARSTPRRTCP